MLVVTIRSFSEKFLDFSLDQIKKVLVEKNSTNLYNITRLPKSFKKVTVVRSPHVNKQSKEKFSYTLHTIQLKLKVKDNLNSIELIKKILPPQVSLKFTTY
jgi:ribosomal protein S10